MILRPFSTWRNFPRGGHFLLFKDQLAESGRQKTKENIPLGKFRLVENDPEAHFPLGRIFRAERHFLLFRYQLEENGRQKTKEIIVPRGKFRPVENDL